MSKEVCEYRLQLRGRPVGSYRVSTLTKRQLVHVEGRLELQGALGRKTISQECSLHKDSFESVHFSEWQQDGSQKRTFEVVFDRDQGLVTAQRGSDHASIPYIQAYRDPLGVFYELRYLQTQAHPERLQVPLIGKDVVFEKVNDVTLETAIGKVNAHLYLCQPGGNYIYVEAGGSRTILKFNQRLDGQVLEATLVKVGYEAEREGNDKRNRRNRRNSRRSNRSRPKNRKKS
jgi:hypothetical protein